MYEKYHLMLIQTNYDGPLSQIMVFQTTYQQFSNKTVSSEISQNVYSIHFMGDVFHSPESQST